jgi:zinc transporter, ZIP family
MMEIWLASLLLVIGTALGSFIVLFFRGTALSSLNVSLSFAGGVMLTASFTSLILPAVEKGGFLKTALGVILGFGVMALVERLFPHEHPNIGQEGILPLKMKKLTLIVVGIIIHNIPEGLSVGIATAYSGKDGLMTALAISIQDIPEGLVVSLPIYALGGGMGTALSIGFLSGGIEGLFSLFGFGFMRVFEGSLPVGMGFGGGAMLYITVKEVFPEAYLEGRAFATTLGFLVGVLLMLFLDTVSF